MMYVCVVLSPIKGSRSAIALQLVQETTQLIVEPAVFFASLRSYQARSSIIAKLIGSLRHIEKVLFSEKADDYQTTSFSKTTALLETSESRHEVYLLGVIPCVLHPALKHGVHGQRC